MGDPTPEANVHTAIYLNLAIGLTRESPIEFQPLTLIFINSDANCHYFIGFGKERHS